MHEGVITRDIHSLFVGYFRAPSHKLMDEDINEYMDENKTPNSREPNEQNGANELDSREYDISTSRGCQGLLAYRMLVSAAGDQKTSDPIGALVPVVLAGATYVVAKLFHKQHKQQKQFKHSQGICCCGHTPVEVAAICLLLISVLCR